MAQPVYPSSGNALAFGHLRFVPRAALAGRRMAQPVCPQLRKYRAIGHLRFVPRADEVSFFELILVRFHVMRKEFLVRWLLDPEAAHFPRERITSFAVLANFNVRTNKRDSIRRPCANINQVSHIALLFPGAITGGLHRIAQWGKGIGWLKLTIRHAHWRVAALQL